jgi:iron complex outermembrane recepter protein
MKQKTFAVKATLWAVLGTLAQVGFAAETSISQLPEVLVTGSKINGYVVDSIDMGTRTNTPVEQIPQSIVVLPRALLEDQGVQTLSDALRNVSNVSSLDNRDSNNRGFKVRGFDSATVVDGVAMPGYFANQESLVNVERVDVVKGPSGGLFGSSQGVGGYATMGGTIGLSTSKATSAAALRQVGVHVGSYAEKGASFDLNQPIDSTLAVRLVGEVSRSNSETDKVFFKKNALFPSMSWTPSADTEVVG